MQVTLVSDRQKMEAPHLGLVREGELFWEPCAERVAGANLTTFTRRRERERDRSFADYPQLWRWSVEDLDGFWQAVWDYLRIEAATPATAVLGRRDLPGAQWFPGARFNFAQHVLRAERPGEPAVAYLSETAPLSSVPWPTFAGQVRILATQLRALGVRPGDRVAGYLPNIPEAMVAMLAAASIGTIWAVCSPDFGTRGVLDRFRQLAPKVLVCADRYQYGGERRDRRDEVRRIVAGLPSVAHVVHVGDHAAPVPDALRWDDLLDHPPVPASEFPFQQVPFDHPLWILFSSGTTGPPEPILHGHGGILLEHLKLQHLRMDLRPGDRVFFFTTTGWMVWNFLVCALLRGAVPVLYDGNPTYPELDTLWRLAQDSRAAFLGTSPSYIARMRQAGVVPGAHYDLSALRQVMPAGSPVPPAVTAWFYANVKPDLWVAIGSGGTDCCTGFVGGVPTKPVYAGEIQARPLGVAAHADATLNRHGVRIGTAEVYQAVGAVDAVTDALVVNLDLPGGGFFMPLFVVLREGATLDAELEAEIRDRLRRDYTRRHVPDRIIAVPAIPRTLTNKKMEIPVRRILLGEDPDLVADRTAMADPDAFDPFIAYACDPLWKDVR